MKKYLSGFQIFYLVFALALVVSFGITQARGLRLLNVFGGGISSHSGHDGPDHK
jgi:hypothetical protein